MERFHAFIEIATFIFNCIGALITIWGALISLFEFLRKEILKRAEAVQLNDAIRIKLGSYLVLALEFFIAADIVKTIILPAGRVWAS